MCDQGEIKITEDCFGVNAEGKPVKKYTLKNKNDFCVQVLDYGATIQSINVPGKCGPPVDVCQGFDDMEGYLGKNNPYFGATIGRVTNRTKPTTFKIGGKCVSLTQNANEAHLHGGCKGFDKVMWCGKINGTILEMKYTSKDGEEGYPGNLCATVCFTITADNDLCITFSATTDKETIVNMTNHAYFNLAGHDAGPDEMKKHMIKIDSDKYTKLDKELVATGELCPVDGGGYDLRCSKEIGAAMKNLGCGVDGFDINYVLKPENDVCSMKLAAEVCHKSKGIKMEVHTTAPGVQFYTGNNMETVTGKCRACYKKQSSFCLETQHFPNSANQPSFPTISLCPGSKYEHKVMYKFRSI